MAWLSMTTAPQHCPIILNVGLPWVVIGAWNAPSEKWVYADFQADMFNGKWNDTYFQNEYEQSPIGWMELPKI